MLIVNPSGWVWLKAQTLSAIVVMLLCSVAWSLVEEHEARLAVTQMVRTAIRNQAFNLSNLIIVSALSLKSATKLLNFHQKKTVSTSFLAKITHLHYRIECFPYILCNYVAKTHLELGSLEIEKV